MGCGGDGETETETGDGEMETETETETARAGQSLSRKGRGGGGGTERAELVREAAAASELCGGHLLRAPARTRHCVTSCAHPPEPGTLATANCGAQLPLVGSCTCLCVCVERVGQRGEHRCLAPQRTLPASRCEETMILIPKSRKSAQVLYKFR